MFIPVFQGPARGSAAPTSWRSIPLRVSSQAGALATGTMGASEAELRPLLGHPRAWQSLDLPEWQPSACHTHVLMSKVTQ